MSKVFSFMLGKTYYNKGFFNALIAFDEYLGDHGDIVEINMPDCQRVLKGSINRNTANQNHTARIYSGRGLRECFKDKFEMHQEVDLYIHSPTRLEIRRRSQ